MDIPFTPDNSAAYGVLKNFQQFLKNTSEANNEDSHRTQLSSIPFPSLMDEDEGSSRKRKYDKLSESAIQKAQTAQLKHRHASVEQAYKKAHLDLETENQKLNTKITLLHEKVENQQSEITRVTKQAIEANNEIIEIRSVKSDRISLLEDRISELEHTNDDIREKLESEQLRHKRDYKYLTQANTELESNVQSMKIALDAANGQVELAKQKIHVMQESLLNHNNTAAELQDFKIKCQELELRLSQAEDAESLSKALKDDMNKLRKLEKENLDLKRTNYNLKEGMENHRLTKEKLLSAHSTLQRYERKLAECEKMEQANIDLKQTLNNIESLQKSSENYKEFELKMCDYRQKEANFVLEKGSLESEIKSLSTKCSVAEEKIVEFEQNLAMKIKSVGKLEMLVKRLKRRLALLSQERDSICSVLQTYDDNTTVTGSDQMMNRVKEVEKINTQLHQQVDALHEELQKLSSTKEDNFGSGTLDSPKIKPSSTNQDKENEKLRKTIEHMVDINKKQSDEIEMLKSAHERNKIKGDYDPAKTKILSFQMNPVAMKREENKRKYENLQEENERLRQKLLKMQNNLDVSTVDALSVKEAEALQCKIDESNLKNQRLKEIFTTKMYDFRQACYVLTGYRIDCTSDKHFKLISRYAEEPSDFLLFQLTSKGEMNLLESEYSRTLGDFIDLHLHHQNSLPMFLSHLTIDLFGQQTIT